MLEFRHMSTPVECMTRTHMALCPQGKKCSSHSSCSSPLQPPLTSEAMSPPCLPWLLPPPSSQGAGAASTLCPYPQPGNRASRSVRRHQGSELSPPPPPSTEDWIRGQHWQREPSLLYLVPTGPMFLWPGLTRTSARAVGWDLHGTYLQ